MNNDGLRAFVAASREWSDSLETHLDHQLLDLDLDLDVAPNPEPDLDLGVAPNPGI